MNQNAKNLEDIILRTLPEAKVRVENLRGDGGFYYSVQVSSPSFYDKTLIDQHRMVYACLKGHWDAEAEPLTLKTITEG